MAPDGTCSAGREKGSPRRPGFPLHEPPRSMLMSAAVLSTDCHCPSTTRTRITREGSRCSRRGSPSGPDHHAGTHSGWPAPSAIFADAPLAEVEDCHEERFDVAADGFQWVSMCSHNRSRRGLSGAEEVALQPPLAQVRSRCPRPRRRRPLSVSSSLSGYAARSSATPGGPPACLRRGGHRTGWSHGRVPRRA